jgi:type II secretory pathway pseudopilin PulG
MQGQISHNFSRSSLSPVPGPVLGRVLRPLPARRGFTIVEIIFGILIIAIIMGLLIVSVRAARRSVVGAVTANDLREIGKAIEQFQNEFGFSVPLVAEQRLLTAENAGAWDAIVTRNATPNTVRVYSRSDAGDLAILRGVDSEQAPSAVLPFGNNSQQVGANDGAAPTAGFDQRFSTLSLGYFLVGGLDSPYSLAVTGVPLDGLQGPGFYQPRADGTFDVPESVRRVTANERKQIGKRFESFLKTDGSLKLAVEITNTGGRRVELQDRNGAAVRYYLWLNEFDDNGVWRQPETLAEMNVPRLVGRLPVTVAGEGSVPATRDLETNIGLRGRYMWAVVAAGPNGVFGDESDETIARGLGVSSGGSAADLLRRRFDAERDNIVVYGEAKR